MNEHHKINGIAAETLIKGVLRDMGFRAQCPATEEQILEELIFNSNGHFEAALYHLEREYGTYECGAGLLADYALASDVFIEDRANEVCSIDVTVNSSHVALSHKRRVRGKTAVARKRLGFGKHLLVIVDSTKCLGQLGDLDQWYIVDTILDALEAGEEEVVITL